MSLQLRVVVLALFALPAWATLSEMSFAQTFATVGLPPVLGCSDVAQGTFYASVSVTCSIPASQVPCCGGTLALSATAESGIGPFGIGVATNTLDVSNPGSAYEVGDANARSSWSDSVTPVGGVGAGFVQFEIYGQIGTYGTDGLNFGGIQVCSFNCGGAYTIPIIFGDPYTLSLFSTDISASDNYGPTELYVSSVDFFNSAGKPINGSLLVSTPEPSSWILALVPVAYFLRRFTRRGSPHKKSIRL
jgi:hypothetical protein